jgi:hypothetical protein
LHWSSGSASICSNDDTFTYLSHKNEKISFIYIELFHQLLGLVVVVLIMVEPEGPLVQLPHVLHHGHLHQVLLEDLQLEVNLAVVVGEDGNSIFELIGVGVCGVVHEDHVTEFSINHPQILYVESFPAQEAMLAEETVMHPLSLRIQVIDNHVSIA